MTVEVAGLPALARRRVRVPLLAQAPTGPSCTATFSDVRFSATTLADLRDGS